MLGDIATTELYTVLVRNVPSTLTKDGLLQLFSIFGDVLDCYVGKGLIESSWFIYISTMQLSAAKLNQENR